MDDSFDSNPESGEAFTIPLVEQCPRLRAMFEALRHELHPPDFSDSNTQSGEPRSTRSKARLSSSESQSQRNMQPLPNFQHTITPPTDAECGLPSATFEALSKIPTNLLPLSRTLASAQRASVISGFNRSELSASLAHAANLRRAGGRARAILVITSSESAVREWIVGMCQALDEVQVISYSRAKTKRQATLLRLGQAQYPGIVVAAERSLKDGIREMWEALRQNRVAKKWELVFSEVVTDKNIEGECSPLRMIRDGIALKGVIAARKGLTKKKTCMLASEQYGCEVEKVFWLSKEDIRNTVTEEGRKEEGGSLIQRPRPRRRSPRLCSALSAESKLTPSVAGKGQIKRGKRKSSDLRKEDGSKANRSSSTKNQGSRSLGSSSISGGNDKFSVSDSEFGDESWSSKAREKIESRARALRLYSTGSSNSSTEKFYTPPSRAPTPTSKDKTPEKFFSPRTSFSPKKPIRGTVDRLPRSRKTRPDHFIRLSLSPTKPCKSQIVKEMAPKCHKFIQQESFSSGSHCSPVKRADLTRKRNKRLDLGCSPSGDQLWSSKTRRNAVKTAAKNRLWDSDSSDDEWLLGKDSSVREKAGRDAVVAAAKNRGPSLSYDSSDDQRLVKKLRGKKERTGRNSAMAAAKNRKLDADSSDDLPLLQKCTSLIEKTGRSGVRRAAKNVGPELSYDSSDDQPLLTKLSGTKERAGRKAVATTAKSRRLDFDTSDDLLLVRKNSDFKRMDFDTSDDLPMVRKNSDFKQKSGRPKGKGVFTPPDTKRRISSNPPRYGQEAISSPPVRRSVPLLSPPTLATGMGKLGGGRRRSVFDEFRSSMDARPKIPHTAIPRAKSFPAPIQVKREDSPLPQPFKWTWGNPKFKNSGAANRRKSFPASSSSSSFLPVKNASLKPGKKVQMTGPDAITPRRVPRLVRASRSDRRGSTTPRRKSPIVELATRSKPREPEVIVISSGTEDEITPQPKKAARKRRICDENETRNDSGRVVRVRSRNDTSSRAKSPSPISSRPRDRFTNGNSIGTRSRPMHHIEGAAVAQSDDMGDFIRGISRKKKGKDLSHEQGVRYNKLVAEGRRFEKMGMRKEAIDSYEKCVHIYDGDMDLINRYLALLNKEGCIVQSDIARAPAKSPIRKRSRRRRNSGRRGQAGPSAARPEVIDLTRA